MSNAAKFEVPDAGDNGKSYVYNSGSDSHVLTDMATQAELDAHTADTTAAHAASAISFSATGSIAGTDVQTAVAEVATDAAAALSSHEADTTSVHGITDTSALLTTSSGIDALSDVTITAAASGDILRHNGTAWVDAVGTTHFEAAGAVAAHEADTTSVHGITNTADLLTKLWTQANAAGQAVELGDGTRAVAIWAEAGGPSIGSKDDSRLLIEAQARWDSDDDGAEGTGIDINKPAVVLRQTGEDHKGALIEFQQYLASGTHNFGTATDSYPGTFTVGSAGYKRVGWILCHYDSPNPADGIHQHMNFETAQADLSTIVTRFQISWGEDIALASFPNSHVRFYDDKEVRFGSDDDVTLKFDTASGRIVATGATWRFGTGSSSVWIDVTNGRLGVGPSLSSPSAPLHLERANDGQSILARNTTGAGNTGAVIKAETQTAASRVFQSGIQTTDSTARFSIETSGKMEWGAGSASARDTNLYRSAADTLKTDDNLVVGGTLTIGADTVQEVIRDTMATALVAGTNVTITPNDGADTITIAAAGGGGSVTGGADHLALITIGVS